MSYRLTVDVIGKDELVRALRQAGSITTRELSRAIANTAYSLEGRAKRNAPIDQGTLRSSIHTDGPKVAASNIEAAVGTNLHYAAFQESGTGIYGPKRRPITPVNANLLAWKGGGGWHFARRVKGSPAKWYMKKARDETKPDFRSNMTYTTVANQLKTLLLEVTDLQAVYDYNPDTFDSGYPAATITAQGHQDRFADTAANLRAYTFVIRVYYRTAVDQDAETILRGIADQVITKLEAHVTVPGVWEIARPTSGTFTDGVRDVPVLVFELTVAVECRVLR